MKLFHFSEEQQHQLRTLAADTGKELLQLNFSDPGQDQIAIRRHAYVKGKFELLSVLLEDDFPEPETNLE